MTRRPSLLAALIAATAAAAAVAFATPAQAINSYNSHPAPERTETGIFLVLQDTDGNGSADNFDWWCSGAMISDDVYLTAAHCLVDWPAGARFFVSLDQNVQAELDHAKNDLGLTGTAEAQWFVDNGHAVEGTGHYDPAYGKSQSDPHDIAVVDFSDAPTTPADVWTFVPAQLPSAGELDALGTKTLNAATWLTVGYGEQESPRKPGGPTHPGGGVRYEANVGFNSLNPSWVRLAMNQSQGYGGACYGDSGGPNFITVRGQLVLAATTVTGDTQCFATNVAYRTDTASARAFLGQYVTLP